MIKKLLLALFLIHPFFGYAQLQEPCLFDEYQRSHSKFILESEKKIKEILQEKSFSTLRSTSVRVIPVVVHVLHLNGLENISDAQIQSQIEILNEDYQKMLGTNGDGNGVDTEVEFRLAKITPDGKCTNGIVRIQTSLTNHKTYERTNLSQLSFWDNARYLNMYVVKTINNGAGTLGYSSFPGGPPNEDGIVMLHNAFGNIGTVSQTSSYNLGRTGTHEVGHWFGLYHTFNNGCGTDTCSDGDYVCDTPPAANPNFGCPGSINSCSNDVPNVNDQIQNYMDYSNDICKNMLSAGQKGRMDATLSGFRWNIWQPSNITSTGCDSGYVSGPCNVIADFTSNGQNICIGNSVNFTNKSLNSPVSFLWNFPGGTPSTATTANATVTYNTVGNYPVKLIATNSVGTDSVTFVNYINVSIPGVGQTLPYSEGFEDALFPPNGIVIDNPDVGITWERDTIAVPYSGLASAKINNLINTNYGQADALILPAFNLTGYSYTPYLKFRWAYARSDANYSDELVVLMSKDCGVNFTQILYRTGTSLVTAPTQTTPYIPDSNTVWKSANVSLNNFTNYNNVILKIVNVTDGGNNLYIDDILIGDPSLDVRDDTENEMLINVHPNPFSQNSQISYELKTREPVTISVHDIIGRELQFHQLGEQLPGSYSFQIDAKTMSDSGIYFIKMRVGDRFYIRKIIFIK